jgi:hypothetical protein
MKLKDTKWKKCKTCHQRTTMSQEESFGCDECKRPIDEQLNTNNSKHRDHLQVAVFRNNREGAEHLHFCSWRCVLAHLPKIKTDYFVSLPFLQYDGSWPGTTAADFFKALKP